MTFSPRSIRNRLLRAVLGVVALGWLGTVALTAIFIDREMNEGFDEELELVAETTIVTLETGSDPAVPRLVEVAPDHDERLLRIIRPGVPQPVVPWVSPSEDGFFEQAGWRVLRRSGDHEVVEVAHNQAWRRSEMAEAAVSLLILVGPVVALLIWGIRRALRRALAPLDDLAEMIAGRGPDDLSPLPEAGLARELRPLAQGLNGYLARIDDLRAIERRFVANAAHELRTPIAAIRGRLDLLGGPGAVAALPMLDDLTRRVERLLQLSRSEAGLGLGRGPSDLLQVARLLVAEARRQGAVVHFDDGDLEHLSLPVDADALAILIRNLLENALEHGSGPVRVVICPAEAGQGGGAALMIENPTAQVAFVEAPFAKGPGSRGLGLGLSIVAALATAMGADVEKSIRAGLARVVVRF